MLKIHLQYNAKADLKDIYSFNEKFFFLSENIIRMFSSEGDSTHLFEVYRSKNIIQSFYPINKDCVYILLNADIKEK